MEKNFLACLLCLLAFLYGVNGVSQGDPCTNHADCDSGSTYLECDFMEQVCRCHEPDAWYDPRRGYCVLLEGAPCSLTSSQGCALNSFCLNSTNGSPAGHCRCTGDLKANRNRMCFLEAGQICNPHHPDQCDTVEFQACHPIDRICVCPQGWYGPVSNSQLILEAGGRCRLVANQVCSTSYPTDVKCTTNSQCVKTSNQQKCLCDDGVSPNSVGKCVLGYGTVCGPQNPGNCDHEGFQYCQQPEGRCLCHDEYGMMYNNILRKCEWKLDNSCVWDSPISCPQHAFCDVGVDPPYPPGLSGNCKCDFANGWINDGWGNCVQIQSEIIQKHDNGTALENI